MIGLRHGSAATLTVGFVMYGRPSSWDHACCDSASTATRREAALCKAGSGDPAATVEDEAA